MSKLVALTLTIGVLALIDTWLFGLAPMAALHLQVWMSFVSWGTHFMAGGKTSGAKAAVLSMSFGALVGMCAALAIGQMSGLGSLAAPVGVGVGAALIVVASKVPTLEAIPAGFFGFACIFGMLGLTPHLAPTAAFGPTVISIIIGAAFGYVSE
ncbi:MAG: DUF1097 domain-containing protein, partial [Stellaceae bacterium]